MKVCRQDKCNGEDRTMAMELISFNSRAESKRHALTQIGPGLLNEAVA